MAETTARPTDDIDGAVVDDAVADDAPESFTSESSTESFTTVTPREIITAPAAVCSTNRPVP